MKSLSKCLVSAAAGSVLLLSNPSITFSADLAQHITVYVLRGGQSPKGPDGHGHDMILPANYALKVGEPVELTIINYDEGPHTMTSETMGVDIQIAAGLEQADGSVKPVTTHVTITPKQKGTFRWHCLTPCDKGGHYWAMSNSYDGMGKDGYMAGYFVVM